MDCAETFNQVKRGSKSRSGSIICCQEQAGLLYEKKDWSENRCNKDSLRLASLFDAALGLWDAAESRSQEVRTSVENRASSLPILLAGGSQRGKLVGRRLATKFSANFVKKIANALVVLTITPAFGPLVALALRSFRGN